MAKIKPTPKPKTTSSKTGESYTAQDIYVLEGLEPVRKRPGMYIGSTGVDGLHHLIWEVVDNSVTYGTPVFIKDRGKTQLTRVGELVDSLFEKNQELVEKSNDGQVDILRRGFKLESLSFDPSDLNLKFQSVFSLIRHRVNSDIFRITLQNNRQVEITPYHSLFTLKEGQVVPIKGAEIEAGTPIVVPKIWPEHEYAPTHIDLIDELLKLEPSKTKRINLYGLSGFLAKETDVASKIKNQIAQWSSSKTGRVIHSANVWQDYTRYNYLPINLCRVLDSADLDKIKSAGPLVGTKRGDNWKLPISLNITRELAELLGIFAAEGSIISNNNSQRIVFSFGAHETRLIDYTVELISKVFDYQTAANYVHETARTVAVNSNLVSLLFREVIGTGENSGNKKVPNLIFDLPRELRTRYLIGYMSGDGYPTKTWIRHLVDNDTPPESERRKFTAVAKGRELVDGLSYILSSLNKTYSYGERKKKPGDRDIQITYKGITKTRAINSQEISHALDFYWNTHSSYLNYLPVKELVAKIFWQRPYSFSLNTSGGVSAGKIESLQSQGRVVLYPGADKFMVSDLGVLRVRKIEKIVYNHPWVYDICVPNGQNFVGGYAPIILHNSLDEAMAGHAKNIEISLLSENRVKVKDDGRGIPVEKHKQSGVSALETVMTTLHAGGKFGGESYKIAAGLHGVGVSVVNALSIFLKVEVCRDGGLYEQEYVRGEAKKAVKKVDTCKGHGTTVTFEPDPEVFKEIKYDWERILNHLRQQAYLTKGVKIEVKDERAPIKIEKTEKGITNVTTPSHTFYFEGGIVSYVNFINRNKDKAHPNIFYIGKDQQGIFVETALQYTTEIESHELSFANNVHTIEGGMHLTGFRSAITRTLNDYARKNGLLKEKDENLTGEDSREGLTVIVSVKLREPQFEGQTKAKLGTPDARTAVESVINTELADWLERNPNDARAIIGKVALAAKARLAAKAAKESVIRKGALEGFTLPGKLADCSSKKPEESELFIVEGESAGGSSKQGRNRRTQAILPLKGKILNVEKARIDKMLASEEIRALVIALGTAIADEFDLGKLRYHKVVIMTDADVDGSHIRTLLLTLFYRYFQQLIDKGHIYIAQPPLYKIQKSGHMQYAYNDAEKEKIMAQLASQVGATAKEKTKKTAKAAKAEGWEVTPLEATATSGDLPSTGQAPEGNGETDGEVKIAGVSIQRYKGLGEMNPDQLWETTMNPENRVLLQVTMKDAQEADKIFDILMGSDVLPRKKFIQTHAKNVKNLDI